MNLILKQSVVAVASTLALATAIPAGATFLNFDNVGAGATANSAAAGTGITFAPASFLPNLDGFGDPIPGSEHWQADATLPDVLVQNPNTFAGGFYGPAPSGANALDARFQPTLLQFGAPTDITRFSTVLDNSTLGDVPPSYLLFLGASGSVLGQIASDQKIAGYGVNTSSPGFLLPNAIPGVSSILLPSGAYYDNIYINQVPEPASTTLMIAGLGILGAIGRKYRSRQA